MPGEDEGSGSESDTIETAPSAEIRATEIVDLEQWIVAVGVNPEDQTADEIDPPVDVAKPEAATEEEPPFTFTQEGAVSWTFQREQTQLAFSFG